MEAVSKLIRAMLPWGHHWPAGIWRALSLDNPNEWRMTHYEVAYCAQQGVMPAQLGTRALLCDNPTVYYGVDENRSNCATCGHTGASGSMSRSIHTTHLPSYRVSYLIRIRQHVQVYSHNSPT